MNEKYCKNEFQCKIKLKFSKRQFSLNFNNLLQKNNFIFYLSNFIYCFCHSKKFFASTMKCSTCKKDMNWTKLASTLDKYMWGCQQKECKNYKTKKSIRHGSIFHKSKFSLQTWILAIYLWSEHTGLLTAARQLGICTKSAGLLYKEFRAICKMHFERYPIKLGGPGVVVEIDESCFSHKPKHHRGRPPTKPVWVFGLVDTSVHPGVGYMEIIKDKSAA